MTLAASRTCRAGVRGRQARQCRMTAPWAAALRAWHNASGELRDMAHDEAAANGARRERGGERIPRLRSPTARLWRNRGFTLFWFGQALSGLGDAVAMIAMPLLV